MCYPVGLRIILRAGSLRKWPLSKLDVKDAYLQNSEAKCDVYGIPYANQATAGAAFGCCSQRRTAQSILALSEVSERQHPDGPRIPSSFGDDTVVSSKSRQTACRDYC